MRSQYKVICPDWGEDDEDPFIITCYSPHDAIHEWCEYGESHSWFADGYPQNLLLKVVDEAGTVTYHRASTEWDPSYYFEDEAALSTLPELDAEMGEG